MKLLTVLLLLAASSSPAQNRAHDLNVLARSRVTGLSAENAAVLEPLAESLTLANAASDQTSLAESLFILATQFSSRNDLKEEEAALRRIVEKSPDCWELQLELARVTALRGNLAGGRALNDKTTDFVERQYGPASPEMARALTTSGALLNAIRLFPEAEVQLERAIAIGENAPGTGLAESFATLAYALYSRSGYAAAQKAAERAILLFRQYPGESAFEGRAHQTFAEILTAEADYDAARTEAEQAISIDKKLFGARSLQAADDMNATGVTFGDPDPATAKKWFSGALDIYQEVLGPENTRTGGALQNLGTVLVLLHDFTEARRCFERALAIQTKALGPDNPGTASLYQGLARVAAATGDYAGAKDLLSRNLAIWTATLGPTHDSTLHSRTFMADIVVKSGDKQGCLTMALDVSRQRRQFVSDTMRGVTEKQALQLAGRDPGSLNSALTLAAELPDRVADVWDELIRSRTLVLDEMAARYRLVHTSQDPAIAALMTSAEHARTGLANAAFGRKDNGLPQKRKALREAEEALARVGEIIPAVREDVGFAAVAKALPRDSALVAWVRFRQVDYKAQARETSAAYSLLVLRDQARSPRIIPLGSADRIDGLISGLNREIARERDAAGHSERRNEASFRAAGEALRRAVWDPASPLIAGAKNVYLVPDDTLQLVNFAALPLGSSRYLVDSGPLLHILSSERDLIPTHKPGLAPQQLLAVGAPVFTGQPTAACELQFSPLPASGAETADVAAIWKSLGRPVQTMLGPQATAARLTEAVPGKGILHIATHGFYAGKTCAGSGAVSDNPLLRSGLALTGGVFTAAQAASLDLLNTEWVVLSGCDTGLGDLHTGEGVFGLRRAFQEAGARTVIASLWAVEDESTRRWMKSLYRYRFVSKYSSAQALQAADRDALKARRATGLSTHPFYWAAFIAVERE